MSDIKLKQLRAKTRYLVKRSKTDSWKTFTSSLESKTDSALIWRRVWSLRGFSKNHHIYTMKDTKLCTNPDELSNLLGNFYHNSSDENYKTICFENKVPMSNQNCISYINPHLNEQTKLNSPIQLADMYRVLSKYNSLAPEPDGIPLEITTSIWPP